MPRGPVAKKPLSKAAGASTSPPTHNELSKVLRGVGKTLASHSSTATIIPRFAPATKLTKTFAGNVHDYLRKILQDPKKKADITNPDVFGKLYRGLWKGQDELVSTSSVREIVLGLLENEGKLTPALKDRLVEIFGHISAIRLPTKMVGYALATGKVQHPTKKGAGFFAESADTMSVHNRIDLERRVAVTEAAREALLDPKWTPESVLYAALRRAISFSLNEFVAPITASDVFPYAAKSSVLSNEQKYSQILVREDAKKIFVSLGGIQKSSLDERCERPWEDPTLKKRSRDVSPPRVPPPSMKAALTTTLSPSAKH